jgi:hypothetical protein
MGATKVTYFEGKGRQIPTGFQPGPGTVAVGQGIYDQSTTKKHALGERLQIGNRVFYYAKAGAALVAGMVNESAVYGGSSGTIQTNLTVPTVTDGSNAAGQNKVTLTMATDAAAQDAFADGYLSGYDGGAAYGAGQTYRIKSNEAATAGGALKLTLYDDLVVLFTAGTAHCNVIANEFNGVKTLQTTSVGFVVGVSLIVVASGSYGWLQTYGPCCCLVNGTVTNETAIIFGVTATGSFDAQVAGGSSLATPQLGFLMHAAIASTKYGMVFLQIMT